jgi:hypothetical protein
MITNLTIEHFKSIESLNIDCNQINIFIGEPNTGKSNILEALALFTFIEQIPAGGIPLSSYIRFKDLSNLFTDGVTDNNIYLRIIKQDPDKPGTFEGKNLEIIEEIRISPELASYKIEDKVTTGNQISTRSYNFNFSGTLTGGGGNLGSPLFIKYYSYKEFPEYNDPTTNSLKPPFGENLVALIRAHKQLRINVSDILKAEGYRLLIKPHGNQIEIIKDIDDISFGYPYTILSDTLKRIIFYMLAVNSNKNATLVLEEPESYTFPYYTKYLAEKIALDDQNQYFIATHNPYLLRSIIEKAPKDKVNVFVTSIKDYISHLTKIDTKKIPDLLDADPFFNLSSFVEVEGG